MLSIVSITSCASWCATSTGSMGASVSDSVDASGATADNGTARFSAGAGQASVTTSTPRVRSSISTMPESSRGGGVDVGGGGGVTSSSIFASVGATCAAGMVSTMT